MTAWLRALAGAIQFLTRVPVPVPAHWWPYDMPRVALNFPLVGLLIGIGLWLAQGLLAQAEAEVAAIVLLTGWALLTGNLHLDGLADSADAWAGGLGDRERSLAIMKDPRCGSAALSAVVLTLLGKYAALVVLLRADSALALLIAPMLARSGGLWLLSRGEPAREGSLLEPFRQGLLPGQRNGVLLAVAAAALLLGGWDGLWALLAVLLLGWWLERLARRRLGGMTGDVLGAAIELMELAVLLVFALRV